MARPVSSAVSDLAQSVSGGLPVRHRFANGNIRVMVTVPVYVPAYGLSGDTHHVEVGDHVAWVLSLIDNFLPEHLLSTVDVEVETYEGADAPPGYHSYLVRHGGFVAWTDRDPRVDQTQASLRPVCAIGDSSIPDDRVPEAEGEVVALYWGLDLLRQRPSGPWDSVPGIGLVEVASTEADPDQASFTAYFPSSGVDPDDGHWRHIGWIAMLRFS